MQVEAGPLTVTVGVAAVETVLTRIEFETADKQPLPFVPVSVYLPNAAVSTVIQPPTPYWPIAMPFLYH